MRSYHLLIIDYYQRPKDLIVQMSENENFHDFDDRRDEGNQTNQNIQEKTPHTDNLSNNRINLFFRSTIGPGEKLEKLQVDPEMSVKELSITLGEIFGLDPQDFHLSVSGRTMDSDDILSNYDLEDGLEVLIIPVSTAG
jgi:hypothetical protein